MAEGVDYSGSRPSSICMYAQGKRFVARYFGAGGSWKHATRAEVAAHHAVGLSVVALVEGDEQDALRGKSMGRSHATLGLRYAQAAGMPSGRPLYFAIDFDMQPHQAGKVADYLRGCAEIVGVKSVGVYGGYGVVEWARANGLASWFFQTYAWSHDKWSKYNHFEQYRNHVTVCGATVDLDRSKKLDFGQWPAPKQSAGDAPPPPSDTTVDTGWDFTTHIDALADTMSGLGESVGNYARAIDALGT